MTANQLIEKLTQLANPDFNEAFGDNAVQRFYQSRTAASLLEKISKAKQAVEAYKFMGYTQQLTQAQKELGEVQARACQFIHSIS